MGPCGGAGASSFAAAGGRGLRRGSGSGVSGRRVLGGGRGGRFGRSGFGGRGLSGALGRGFGRWRGGRLRRGRSLGALEGGAEQVGLGLQRLGGGLATARQVPHQVGVHARLAFGGARGRPDAVALGGQLHPTGVRLARGFAGGEGAAIEVEILLARRLLLHVQLVLVRVVLAQLRMQLGGFVFGLSGQQLLRLGGAHLRDLGLHRAVELHVAAERAAAPGHEAVVVGGGAGGDGRGLGGRGRGRVLGERRRREQEGEDHARSLSRSRAVSERRARSRDVDAASGSPKVAGRTRPASRRSPR